MNTYTREQLTSKTQAQLLKMAKQATHPDKVDAEYKDQAHEYFTKLDSMSKDELIDLLVLFFNHNLFKKAEPTMTINEQLIDLQTAGKTRKQAKAWLLFEHGIDGKQATPWLDEVYSRSSGASKTDIVAHIIHCQGAGYTNSEIAESLCSQFNWAPSTGKTVVSHLSYMIEYARQTN